MAADFARDQPSPSVTLSDPAFTVSGEQTPVRRSFRLVSDAKHRGKQAPVGRGYPGTPPNVASLLGGEMSRYRPATSCLPP